MSRGDKGKGLHDHFTFQPKRPAVIQDHVHVLGESLTISDVGPAYMEWLRKGGGCAENCQIVCCCFYGHIEW